MSDEELADIHAALSDQRKIEALRYIPDSESQKDVAEEIGASDGTVSKYISEFEDTGLLERIPLRHYELTERGEKALSSELLEASTQAVKDPLEDLWPALAYASCNNPEYAGDINLRQIARQKGIKTRYVTRIFQKAEGSGYIEKNGWGDYSITEKGAELVQEGFDFEEENVEYQENDWRGLIERLEEQDEIDRLWPALCYAFTDSINQKDLNDKGFTTAALKEIFNSAEDQNYIEKEGLNFQITEEGSEIVQKGFDFEKKTVEYQENDWEALIERLEEKNRDKDREGSVSTREVKTVNTDSIILEGGLIIPKNRGSFPKVEEGDEIRVENTGERHRHTPFERAAPLD
ncbi:MAG: hypothetical protein ACLFTA_03040 [Candidatus Nanohaloarchaea archaeon]